MSRQDDVRELIQALKREIGAKYRRLGELLKEVRDKEYWKAWGFDSFEAYCEQEIGYRDRKVRYLVATVEGFERAGVTEEEAASIDQSKAAVIAEVLTPANKDEWVEKARSMKTDELRREVARAQGRPVSDEAAVAFTVMLFPSQKAVLVRAEQLSFKAVPTDFRGVAWEMIAASFISEYGHLDMAPVEQPPAEGDPEHGQDPDL